MSSGREGKKGKEKGRKRRTWHHSPRGLSLPGTQREKCLSKGTVRNNRDLDRDHLKGAWELQITVATNETAKSQKIHRGEQDSKNKPGLPLTPEGMEG